MIKLPKLPAAYILNFFILDNFFNWLSSGSTKAPGNINNNRTPNDFILTFSTLARNACIGSCANITTKTPIIQYQKGTPRIKQGSLTPLTVGNINFNGFIATSF